MIFENGIPRDEGATDFEDSARLAGIMCAVEYPGWEKIPIEQYIVDGKYVRHPFGPNVYDFSRDQFSCLIAAFHKHNRPDLVNTSYITGKDAISGSLHGHILRCSGKKPALLYNIYLCFDIIWAAKVKPEDELNQLLSMVLVAGDFYIKMFCKLHKTWKLNLLDYWAGWRKESDLAQHMIKYIEAKING